MDKKETVLERAKRRLSAAVKRMSYTHKVGRTCMQFVAGEQWDQDEIDAREDTGRPMITVNKVANFANIVVNKNVMERARIKAAPKEDADIPTAKVINGLLRQIQHADGSKAGVAYASALHSLVVAGFGYIRVNADYVNEMAVDEQDLFIEEIKDHFSVFISPDKKFAFVLKYVPLEDYEEEYGEYTGSNWDIPDLKGDNEDDVMLVEYWEIQGEKTTVHKVRVLEDEPPEMGVDGDIEAAIAAMSQRKQKSVRTFTKEQLSEFKGMYEEISQRETELPRVKQYIFAGDDEKSSVDWDGRYIPIIGCYGQEFKLESGDKFYKPLIYDAIGPQKLYNFYRSQDAELMMQAPKAVWQGAEGQFEGHEDEYDDANLDAVSRLTYKPVIHKGQLLPPPQRVAPPQPSVGYYQNINIASEEIKATTGMFDPSLGDSSGQDARSGRAIIAYQQQGDLATFHFTAAFNTFLLLHTGTVLVDLIPRKYDTARAIRILGDDMTSEVMLINQGHTDKDGNSVMYDLTVGEYDVSIETGPSNATKRADAAEGLLELARVVPRAGEVSGDFIAKNMNFPYADDLALRLRATIPPSVLTKAKQFEKEEQGGPTQEQIALIQMQQQVQKVQGALAGIAKENESLKKKITTDKIVVEQIKAKAGITEEQIRAATDIAVAQINQQQRTTPNVTGGVNRTY